MIPGCLCERYKGFPPQDGMTLVAEAGDLTRWGEAGRPDWPTEGAGDCGEEQSDGESVFGVVGPTRSDTDYADYDRRCLEE
jgi:hypothetical protein